jgi:GNAT superfamily N-acetyltransferase
MAESESDYELVADLQGEMWSRAFFEGMKPFDPVLFAKERREYWAEVVRPLRSAGHYVFVGHVIDTPCAYCHCVKVTPSNTDLTRFMPPVAEIVGVGNPVAVELLALGVLEGMRRLGVARRLLMAASNNQSGPFGLWVARDNKVARQFYKSLEWREDHAVRRLDSGIEEIRMRRERL